MLQVQMVKLPDGIYLAMRIEHKESKGTVVYRQDEASGDWIPVLTPMLFSWKKKDIKDANQITLFEEGER